MSGVPGSGCMDSDIDECRGVGSLLKVMMMNRNGKTVHQVER